MKKNYSLFAIVFTMVFPLQFVAQIQFDLQLKPLPNHQTINAFFQGNIVKVGDFDNDGDDDVLTKTELYLNDGNGNFVDVLPLNLQDYASVIKVADWDMDGDLDLLVNDSGYHSHLMFYQNDGTGHFTLNTSNDFLQIDVSRFYLADVDNDGDMDMFITGFDVNRQRTAQILLNDGTGQFTASTINYGSSALFIDCDNDGDLDLFIRNYSNMYFTNDGTGHFTLQTTSPLGNFDHLFFNVADVNGDGFPDLITNNGTYSTVPNKLYYNDGNGNFVFQGNYPSHCTAWIDIDQDNDLDLFAGNSLYFNDGNGNLSLYPAQVFGNYNAGEFFFGDFNNDNTIDIITNNIMFININMQFFPIIKSYFPSLKKSDIAAADIDNDGDQDVFLTGEAPHGQLFSALYTNDGNGQFSLNRTFQGLKNSHIEFADIDNDGDVDILYGGKNAQDNDEAHLYKNDGNGNYTEQTYPNVGAEFHFIDFDSDGDIDVMYGMNVAYNDGNGNFTNATNDESRRHFAYGDIDGDGGIDIIHASSAAGSYMNFIQRSSGNSDFDLSTTSGENASVYLQDLDNDGDLDFIISCLPNPGNQMSRYVLKIYENDGTGHFTVQMSSIGFFDGNIAFADVDNDNDIDILISAFLDLRVRPANVLTDFMHAELLVNNGSFQFSEAPNITIPNLVEGGMTFAFVDGDQKIDLLMTGSRIEDFTDMGDTNSLLYRNTSMLSIDEYGKIQRKSMVFPNPNQGVFSLKNIEAEDADIQIVDMSGKVLYHFNKRLNNNNLFQVKLTKGIYFLMITSNDTKLLDKFIIE